MRQRKLWGLVVCVVVLHVVCRGLALGQSAPVNGAGSGSTPPPPGVGELMRQNGGSLLRATLAAQADPGRATLKEVSFTAVPEPEPRTLKKHDLVTIIVRETSEYKSEATTDLKKKATLDARLEEFAKLNVKNFAIEGGGIGTTPPSIKASGKGEFKGDGSVDRSDELTARITAEVLDVKPNGTLVLQARKFIKTDEEEQEMILTGVCRAEDVTADNSIYSHQLHDQTLMKMHKGAVRDATKRGWLPKLLDLIAPF